MFTYFHLFFKFICLKTISQLIWVFLKRNKIAIQQHINIHILTRCVKRKYLVFGCIYTKFLLSKRLSLRARATSEAICQVQSRFFFNFSRIFKLIWAFLLKNRQITAKTWQIASLVALARNDSRLF